MSETYVAGTMMIVKVCPSCHMTFGVPEFFDTKRRDDHKTFHCPNGHDIWFPGESDNEKLLNKLNAERRNVRDLNDSLDLEREDHKRTEYQRRAIKGQLTKTKKRIGSGVCPCCNRTFRDLARHMTGQHPDYAGAPHD